jgi:hypothetical protein
VIGHDAVGQHAHRGGLQGLDQTTLERANSN